MLFIYFLGISFFMNIIITSGQEQQCVAPGYDFDGFTDTQTDNWDPNDDTQLVQFAPCGFINNICGSNPPPQNQCSNPGSEGQCCGVCQSWVKDGNPQAACLGTLLGSVTVLSETSVQIQYSNGDTSDDGVGREVIVVVNCDSTAGVLDFDMFEPALPSNPPPEVYTYTLTLKSSTLCAVAPPVVPPKSRPGASPDAISGGSVFLILFFIITFLYFLIGILYNKHYGKKTGIDVVPNIEFWKEVPSYLKEGIIFTKDTISATIKSRVSK